MYHISVSTYGLLGVEARGTTSIHDLSVRADLGHHVLPRHGKSFIGLGLVRGTRHHLLRLAGLDLALLTLPLSDATCNEKQNTTDNDRELKISHTTFQLQQEAAGRHSAHR